MTMPNVCVNCGIGDLNKKLEMGKAKPASKKKSSLKKQKKASVKKRV